MLGGLKVPELLTRAGIGSVVVPGKTSGTQTDFGRGVRIGAQSYPLVTQFLDGERYIYRYKYGSKKYKTSNNTFCDTS